MSYCYTVLYVGFASAYDRSQTTSIFYDNKGPTNYTSIFNKSFNINVSVNVHIPEASHNGKNYSNKNKLSSQEGSVKQI